MIKLNGTDKHAVQKLYCSREGCKQGFRDKYSRVQKNIDAYNLSKKFLMNKATLAALKDDTGLKISTINGNILNIVKSLPPVFEVSKKMKQHNIWSYVLGIDTTAPKVGGKEQVFLYVVDTISGDTLDCGLIDKEDTSSIVRVLIRIRDELDYHPIIIVCDLDPAILKAIGIVFSSARIQACLYHAVAWLDKELPTLKTAKRIGKLRVAFWKKAKRIITKVVYARDMERRNYWMDELLKLDVSNDGDVKKVVNNFRNNLHYYMPLDQIKAQVSMNNLDRIVYNNVCEAHIGLVKRLGKKMHGWKSLNTFMPYVNAYWYFKRNEQTPQTSSALMVPLNLFFEQANLEELERLGIPKEVLVASAISGGCRIVGNFALSPEQLDKIKKRILASRKRSPRLNVIMEEFELDMRGASDVVIQLGFELRWHGMNPECIEIIVPDYENGSTELDNR